MKVIRTLLILGALLGISALTLQGSMATAKKGHPRPTPTPTSVVHGAPTLLSPANGAFVPANPTLVWSAVPGAVWYHLQVGSGTHFDEQANFIEYWDLTETSYFVSSHPEAYFSHVYWRVQALDANYVGGPWSEIGDFTITTPYHP